MRTFIQTLQGFAVDPTEPTEVTVTVNGEIRYQGEIPTLDIPPPSAPDPEHIYGEDVFSWQAPIDFEGSFDIVMTVDSGRCLFCYTKANYVPVPVKNAPPEFMPGGEDHYADAFYNRTEGDVTTYDPTSDITIDDVVIDKLGYPELQPYQWSWLVNAGSVFTCKINTLPGIAAVDWSPSLTFDHRTVVTNEGSNYVAMQDVPEGIAITDVNYWKKLEAA
jgi:hypothetical protein